MPGHSRNVPANVEAVATVSACVHRLLAAVVLRPVRDESPLGHGKPAALPAGLGANDGNQLERDDVEARSLVGCLRQTKANAPLGKVLAQATVMRPVV